MSRLDGLRHRLRVLFRGEAYAREIEREMRFHIELESDAQESGRVGNVTYYREEVRRMTLQTWLDRIRQNAGYAVRGLRRTPGFTIAVVLTLGLGVGVNAAIFSLLSRIFGAPPAGITAPDQVRRLYFDFDIGSGNGERFIAATARYSQFAAVQASADSLVDLGIATMPESTTVRDGNARIPARQSFVNASYFHLLGVRPAAGRFLSYDEGRIETPAPVVVLSDAFWRRAYGADRGVTGRQVTINQRVFTIIGIAPPGFTGIDIDLAEIWLSANTWDSPENVAMNPAWYRSAPARFSVIARIASPALERRLLAVGSMALRELEDRDGRDTTAQLLAGPILQALGPSKAPAEVVVATRVAGIAIIVLVIACANVTNLLLLRAAWRRREIAVRRALGVSNARLLEQFAVESLLLSLAGGVVAVTFAWWAGGAVRRLVLPQVHWASAIVDRRTLALVGVASVLIAFVIGFAPTLQALRPSIMELLAARSRSVRRNRWTLRGGLLALQAALCVVLLVGAGLFMRSLSNVASIGVGYETAGRLFIRPTLDEPRAHDAELRVAIPLAADRLRLVDGVIAVGYSSHPPIQGASFRAIYLPDRDSIPQLPGDIGPSMAAVSPGFFSASGLALRGGRDFTVDDRRGAESVIVVGDAMARLFWPGESAIGKCFMILKRDRPCSRVVGIVSDAHRRGIIEAPISQFYVPIAQTTESPRDLILHVRGGREAAVARTAEEILRPLVPGMTGLYTRTFDSVLEPQLRPWRLGATVFAALGFLALCVASVGVYSVVAYGVSQRHHEMGIRIALGAQRDDIVNLVLGDGLRAVVAGLAVGIAISLAMGPLIAALLFGVTPRDSSVLIGASALLCGVGGVACLVPALRAARVDPARTLRTD